MVANHLILDFVGIWCYQYNRKNSCFHCLGKSQIEEDPGFSTTNLKQKVLEEYWKYNNRSAPGWLAEWDIHPSAAAVHVYSHINITWKLSWLVWLWCQTQADRLCGQLGQGEQHPEVLSVLSAWAHVTAIRIREKNSLMWWYNQENVGRIRCSI